VWASGYGGTQQEWPYSIVADAAGNTYLSGIFYSLGPAFGPYSVVQSGQGDAFVVRFNSSGVPQWAQQIGGSLPDNIWNSALNSSGNVVVVGDFKSSALGFSPNLVNAGGYDMFIVTYDSNGGAIMSKSFGGANDENVYAVTTDFNGNIYIAGAFMSPTLVMDSFTLTNVTGRDMFVAKLTSSGTVVWVQRNDGNLYSEPKTLDSDAFGNVYLTGQYNFPSITFGSTTFSSTSWTTSGLNIYVVKYDSTGSVIWAKGIMDHANEQTFDAATDPLGNLLLTGVFGYSVTIGSHQLVSTMQGSSDIFLAKLCSVPGTPTTVPGVTVCPGAIASLSLNIPPAFTCNWYSAATNGSLLATANTFSTATSLTVFAALKDTIPGCGMIGTGAPITFSIHPHAVVSVTGNTLTANVSTSAGFYYEWYDCNYGGLVSEYTNKPFEPQENGSYALIVSIGNCIDTSDCYSYMFDAISESQAMENFHAFVNNRNITISNAAFPCTVTDLLGREVCRLVPVANEATAYNMQPGIYFVSDKHSRAVKLVVQ
jgi:hypothetical protein